jgi:hypothetical protein
VLPRGSVDKLGKPRNGLPQRGSHEPGLQGRGGPGTIVWTLVSRWNQRIDRPPFDVVRWVPPEAVRRQNATRSRVRAYRLGRCRSERNREGEAAASRPFPSEEIGQSGSRENVQLASDNVRRHKLNARARESRLTRACRLTVQFSPLVACESVVIGACDPLSLLLRDGSSRRSMQIHRVDD